MSAVATSLRFSTWQRLSWPRPEWWSLGLCLGAWVLILSPAVGGGAHASHGHLHHATAAAAPMDIYATWPTQIFWWLVMVVAMMFLLLVDPIRNTAARSLWSRRHRGIGIFLAGYLGPWLLFGIVASVALSIVRMQSWLSPSQVNLAGFAVALIWQVTPAKRRAVLSCHRTRPLAPTGLRADRDCLLYGWTMGTSCLVSCWALMFVCMLSNHSLLVMVSITVIGFVERSKERLNRGILCGAIAVIGLISVIWPGV